eukprot:scaffold92619_cov63-Phaeocystis_antarctica.AAC.1
MQPYSHVVADLGAAGRKSVGISGSQPSSCISACLKACTARAFGACSLKSIVAGKTLPCCPAWWSMPRTPRTNAMTKCQIGRQI